MFSGDAEHRRQGFEESKRHCADVNRRARRERQRKLEKACRRSTGVDAIKLFFFVADDGGK
jgi:hypothetical protein